MSASTIGIIMFLIMVGLILIGVPIFASMLSCSMVGFYLIGGTKMLLSQITSAPFTLGANYSYAVLPLFMLVGSLAGVTGIAQGAFNAMYKLLGRVKGGLLYTVVGANAAFGACSGISVAGNVVFGKIAMPELDRYGYDRRLSLGCITGAGVLSSLIPPSIPIIMWCLVCDVSISTALMYGLSLGIVMIILLCLAIRLYITIFPDKAPSTKDIPKVPLLEKLKALTGLLPIVMVFVLIIGGTMGGFFTSTVAGAVASVALIIFALIKRIPIKEIWNCIWEGAVMNAGMFPIIIAGSIFSRFVTLTRLADTVAGGISNLNLPPFAIFCLVVLFYLGCGCVMDIPSTIIITVPIIFPLLTGLGYNPFAITVLLVMMCDVAGMTPPIGMNVFAVSNALRIKPMEIFKGSVMFFCTDLVAVLLMGAFPIIIEFIPQVILGLP